MPFVYHAMIEFVLLFLSWTTSGLSTCSTGAISLPVTDVILPNGWSTRGVPLTVGTPPQNLSFMPHDYLNDTWLYNSSSGFCNDWPGGTSRGFCITLRGGEYDVGASSTAKPAPNVHVAGGDASDVQRTLGTHLWDGGWLNDVLSFADNMTLPNFPVGMAPWDYGGLFDTQNNIGLGLNSTILTASYTSGKIASRSWSWWWGRTGANVSEQMSGSIVFGGYDKAKTKGSRYTQSLVLPEVNCASGMRVTITDLLLDFPNGTVTSLLGRKQIFACLQPDFNGVMTLPQEPYYDAFESLTGTHSTDAASSVTSLTRGPLYTLEGTYAGGLTIELNNVFSVSIPNDLLVVPEILLTSSGATVKNDSANQIQIVPAPGDEAGTYILGRIFFSAAYLAIDYDESTFTLWEALATENTDLVAFGGNCSSPAVNAPPNNSTEGGTTIPGAQKPGHGEKTVSAGAIAGAVVACSLTAAVLAALAVWWFLRRRRQLQGKPENGRQRSGELTRGSSMSYNGPRFYEAMSGQVLELEADNDPTELVTEERPTELPTDKASQTRQKRSLQGLNSPVELG